MLGQTTRAMQVVCPKIIQRARSIVLIDFLQMSINSLNYRRVGCSERPIPRRRTWITHDDPLHDQETRPRTE